MNTRQPFLRGVVRLQLMLFTASPTVPRLLEVVNTSKIMCAYREKRHVKTRNAILFSFLPKKKKRILPAVLKRN